MDQSRRGVLPRLCTTTESGTTACTDTTGLAPYARDSGYPAAALADERSWLHSLHAWTPALAPGACADPPLSSPICYHRCCTGGNSHLFISLAGDCVESTRRDATRRFVVRRLSFVAVDLEAHVTSSGTDEWLARGEAAELEIKTRCVRVGCNVVREAQSVQVYREGVPAAGCASVVLTGDRLPSVRERRCCSQPLWEDE